MISIFHHFDYKSNAENVIDTLEQEVEVLDRDIEDLWIHLESVNTSLIEANREIEGHLENIDELNIDIDSLNKEIESLNSTIQQKDREIDSLKKEEVTLSRTSKEVVSKGSNSDSTQSESNKSKTEEVESTPADTAKVESTPSTSNKGSHIGDFQATAYAVGAWGVPGTVTRNGTDISETIYTEEGYRIIAADPNVIPLNTVVKVSLPSGDTFKAKVADTGGMIKGNIIDILMDSPDKALQFGRQDGISIYSIN